MSNTFPNANGQLMPNILAGALEVLRQEATLASSINHNFSGAAGQLGQFVNVAVASPLAASDVTPAAIPPNLTDMGFGYVPITINKWKKALFSMNEQDATFYQMGTLIPMQVREAVRSLAFQLNADIFASNISIYGSAGTGGTNPFASDLNTIPTLKQVLDDQLCPNGNRKLVLGHAETTAALKLSGLQVMLNAGDSNALRKGAVGQLFGFDTMGDIQVPTRTAGTGANYVIDGTGNTAVGSTIIKLKTGTGTILVGDLITIVSNSVTSQYVCALGNTAPGVITISPPLVTAATDSDVVTIVRHGATYRCNMAFDPMAFGLVMRTPPSIIEGNSIYGQRMAMTDPVTGMPMMLSYLPGYHAAQWELSIMYGVTLIDPRRAALLLG